MLQNYSWLNDTTLVAAMDPAIAAFSGAFGGWVAAHALLAAERVVNDPDALPLSVNIDFLRGVVEGDVVSTGELVHSTRSLRFVQVATAQADGDCARTTAIFARRRHTDDVTSVAMPTCAAPESLEPIDASVVPVTWINSFDLRFASRAPGERSPAMRSLTWTRLKTERALDYAALLAIADTPLPRIFMHYAAQSKISTVTMSVHFHADRADLARIRHEFVLVEASNQAARHGYYDQLTRIWSRAGRLLATSSQLVWFNVPPGATPAPDPA
ncbi:MAG TPA: thioesterase family protein [Steroidobacteraceae bacterium]|nr:thioesterase family protein [Steroidobacteraceae bacterium]HRX90120.1 thioesterase family protein [Steroidobacteraceae bacterium]